MDGFTRGPLIGRGGTASGRNNSPAYATLAQSAQISWSGDSANFSPMKRQARKLQ
jgi:hypothetical protein